MGLLRNIGDEAASVGQRVADRLWPNRPETAADTDTDTDPDAATDADTDADTAAPQE
jgi:hypothetical protein